MRGDSGRSAVEVPVPSASDANGINDLEHGNPILQSIRHNHLCRDSSEMTGRSNAPNRTTSNPATLSNFVTCERQKLNRLFNVLFKKSSRLPTYESSRFLTDLILEKERKVGKKEHILKSYLNSLLTNLFRKTIVDIQIINFLKWNFR